VNKSKDQAAIELNAFLKKRGRSFVSILIILPFSSILISVLNGSFLSVLFIIALIYYILRVCFQIIAFQCPRCNKTFTYNGFKPSFFTSTCVHCGFNINEGSRGIAGSDQVNKLK